jgi:hypothetical protein
MKAYGITGNLINWFKSYLKARRQKVVIKNNSSAYCEMNLKCYYTFLITDVLLNA